MKRILRWSAGCLTVLAVGCGPTTQSQLTRCQNEKKTLLTRIVDEQKQVETLTTQNEQLTARLADSEKQLARLYQQSSGRYVSSNNSSSTGLVPLTPTVPPTSLSERPNRLIPLGSPAGSVPPPTSTFSSALRSPREEASRESIDNSPNTPSLAAPSNGRWESGWTPKAGAGRGASPGTAPLEGTQRPSGTPRR